jgi:hypothetical protein
MFDRFERAFDQLAKPAVIADDRRSSGRSRRKDASLSLNVRRQMPLGCRGDQHLAQRAVERSPADRFAAPAVAPRRWGHSSLSFASL